MLSITSGGPAKYADRERALTVVEWLRSGALTLAKPIHVRFRAEKFKLFKKVIGESPEAVCLLDVGGGAGLYGEFAQFYFSFRQVTVVNLHVPAVEAVPSKPTVVRLVADGCVLPFADQSFDWVFSNAVIEHVGGWERQWRFACEIRRIARKGYFVTTPNKSFPIEPHTYLPFYQYLSPSWQQKVARFSPGFLREYEEINLLSARELGRLFPEARVVGSGFPLFANSLVAHYSAVPAKKVAPFSSRVN